MEVPAVDISPILAYLEELKEQNVSIQEEISIQNDVLYSIESDMQISNTISFFVIGALGIIAGALLVSMLKK